MAHFEQIILLKGQRCSKPFSKEKTVNKETVCDSEFRHLIRAADTKTKTSFSLREKFFFFSPNSAQINLRIAACIFSFSL